MSKSTKELKTIEEILVPKSEQRFKVPVNWVWTWTGVIAEVIGGGTPKSAVKEYYENGNIPWITPADLSGYEDMYISRGKRNITELGLGKSSAKMLPINTVLLSTRAPIGYVAIASKSLSTNQGFKSFTPSKAYYPPYLYWYLKFSKAYLESLASGSTFKELSGTKSKQIPVPLPPILEQKRIADKVENLLSKINEAKRLINEAKETFELRRAAILDKAFRGKLTAKWREENNLDDSVLEEISQIKDKIKSYGRNSNTLKIKVVTEEETPLKIPRSWRWVRLGELSYYVTSGSRDWSKYYSDTGVMFIRTQDINTNKLNLENVAYMDLPNKVEGKRSLVEKNDILTTITGANVGKCALVDEEIEEAYVSQSVALTKLVDKEMAKYVHYSLLSPIGGGGELLDRAYGIGRPVLSLEDIKNIRIPLAPKNEREKITKILDDILSLNNKANEIIKLENNLELLKESIMNKAFRGELGTNDPNEESALELLKEVLSEKAGR
jgi:type I restriction enzyme, S subunit